MNQRDHRKLLIVEGRTAFLGGINISRVYSGGSFGSAPRLYALTISTRLSVYHPHRWFEDGSEMALRWRNEIKNHRYCRPPEAC